MKKLSDYTNEPNYTGDAQHEADSLLNRGGFFGYIRDRAKAVIGYWVTYLVFICVLMMFGVRYDVGDKIAQKWANLNLSGGVAELKKTGITSTLLNSHWIYKTELAIDYQESEGKRLSDIASYVRDDGDFLLSKKTFDADIYNMDLFGWFSTDARETCDDDFLDESYPIVFNTNYYPNDLQEWEGKQKFRCVYKINKKSTYEFKGEK